MNQKICILLSIILILSRIIRHKVIVEVVIAAHSNKKYTPSKSLSHIRGTKIVCDLIERVLEVLDLLVEWNPTNLMMNILFSHID